jgi:hypothetical protein
MIRDYSMWLAANLRVSWDDHDVEELSRQVACITNIEEAHSIICALTVVADTPTETLRNMLSEGF